MEIGFHHLVVGEVFVPSFAVHHTDFEEILYSCLEFPVDREAWWATVHRVTQSQTRLKRLSMHACIGEGNGNPLQCSCLENPRDRGAGWAAVYGVAQSRTRLKRLSSSSSKLRWLFIVLYVFTVASMTIAFNENQLQQIYLNDQCWPLMEQMMLFDNLSD